jgi:hypothetical protein
VSWGRPTYDRLVDGVPEPLTSSFTVSHSMLLNLLERPGNPFKAAQRLLGENHETRASQLRLMRRAIGIYRELVTAGIVEKLPEPDADGRQVRLKVHLQANFALNQPLSPFALASLELLDPDAPGYALDVVSVIEATLEKPRQVLSAQEKKARGEAVAAMKAEGIDYDARMARLEEITYPQPLAELLQQAFEVYRGSAPWLGDFELAPKSVVRDMYERAMSFGEYVAFYALTRSEGILLRYLADCYKALRQTVPTDALREDLSDIIEWLGELVRQVDSSLLDEWARLSAGGPAGIGSGSDVDLPEEPPSVTSNERAFRVMVRNEMFQRVKLFADERDEALGALDAGSGWDADRWAEAMDGYFDEYEDIDDGPQARGPNLLIIQKLPGSWKVRQILKDPEGNNDWGINAVIDLAASDEAGTPVVEITGVGAP